MWWSSVRIWPPRPLFTGITSIKPEIHLSIPALFEPLELWEKDFRFEVTSNNLSLLLTSLEFIDVQKVQGISACFFSNLGLNSAEIPAAYYRALAHQNNVINSFLNNDKSGILCADPVHFEVGMNDITLTEIICDLSEFEAKEILALLNQHFQQDGLQFVYGSNQHWYVTFPKSEVLKTKPLDVALKKNVAGLLPFSEQRNWQQIQNEVQMLLHSSEVNKHREIAGLTTLNSLWFWGGGKPQKIKSAYKKIFTNNDKNTTDIQGKMFAQAANCEWQKLPRNGKQLLVQLQHEVGKSYVLLDQLQQPEIDENLEAYQLALTQIDEEYIKPLIHAWKKNQIDLIIDAADGSLIRPLKSPGWKFWKKPRQLSDIASRINQQKIMLGQS